MAVFSQIGEVRMFLTALYLALFLAVPMGLSLAALFEIRKDERVAIGCSDLRRGR